MKKLSLLLTATLCLLLVTSANSQGRPQHFNPAVKQYVKDHILPVLKERRLLVEKELTIAEKEALVRYRAELKQIMQQQKERMQQKTQGAPAHEYMRTDEQRAQAHQLHQQVKDIIQQVQFIANNHLPTLDNIHSQLEPSRKQWTDDIAKLRATQTQNQGASRADMKPGMHGGMKPSLFEGRDAYAHFLLMPAQSAVTSSTTVNNDELDEFQSLLGSEPENTGTGTFASFQLLPNPASSELVTGNGQIPTENEFKLIDMQGRVALSMQNIQPAQHINVSQLPNGTYLAQVTGSGQTVENKIVISH